MAAMSDFNQKMGEICNLLTRIEQLHLKGFDKALEREFRGTVVRHSPQAQLARHGRNETNATLSLLFQTWQHLINGVYRPG